MYAILSHIVNIAYVLSKYGKDLLAEPPHLCNENTFDFKSKKIS